MQVSRMILALLALPLFAQLDPSIFDGTGVTNQTTELPEGAGNPQTETSAAEPSAPGTETEAPDLGALPEGPLVEAGEGGPTREPPAAATPMPTPGGNAESLDAEGEAAGVDAEAPPGTAVDPGRAGETIQTSEKISADHAVDFPWDI